jgi:hypothetical protein
MIWYILISLLLIFLMWLLLVPVVLYTNTDRNRYFLTLPGIFKAVVVPEAGLFHIRGWIFFIPFKFNPFAQRRRKERKRKEKSSARKKKKGAWRFGNFRTWRGAIRSFRIKRLEANIDTDDFTLNAWLVPVFSAVNGEKIQLQVNFEGHHSLLLDLRVTLGSILWNILKAKYTSSTNH